MASHEQRQLKHGNSSVLQLLLLSILSLGIVFSPILLYRHWQYYRALPTWFTPPANCQVLICHYPLAEDEFFIRMHSPHNPHTALKEMQQAMSHIVGYSSGDAQPMTNQDLRNHKQEGAWAQSYVSPIPSTKSAETYLLSAPCDQIFFYAWPDAKGCMIEVIQSDIFMC